METITRINGNGQPYTTDLPKITILTKHINDSALARIKENTGLAFVKNGWGNYDAQPTESNQIAALLMTFNYKSRYYNNASTKNTLMLKHDHHVGFELNSVCHDCVSHNGIRTTGLDQDSRLAC